MILYSIVPAEFVFGQCNENTARSFYEIDYMGEKVLVSRLSDDEYVIERLLSTSLKAYLDPRLQPGTIIRKKPGLFRQ